jgi:hypothetical protein
VAGDLKAPKKSFENSNHFAVKTGKFPQIILNPGVCGEAVGGLTANSSKYQASAVGMKEDCSAQQVHHFT